MVYESDFYTTRRPYSSRPVVSSYSVTRRDIDSEKKAYRPSLVADPITAFGKRKPKTQERESILTPINRAAIRPKPEATLKPLQPYISARDSTRTKVLNEVRRCSELRTAGGSISASTDRQSMDVLLPRLHQTAPVKDAHRRIFFVEPSKYHP
ncbi:uncharacterized protein CG45078-like isoform X9 [Bradysia coprophila]|uniref:uncharacterized protein CG45078-like isoform X9 n=1 Tax=Bradysia coprophila TaxID=38358 RepID=UPI00187D8BD7|nr:uncharacterized protein CG45078-like isoform X9 [Bradysia coprophila]